MRKLLLSLFVAGLASGVATAQDDTFRFFFDNAPGAGGVQDVPRLPGNLAFTNPTVVSSGTLYMYAQYGREQTFTGFNLRIDVTGPGEIVSGSFYNHHTTQGTHRWASQTQQNATPNSTTWSNLMQTLSMANPGYGSKNIASADADDSHFDRTDGGNGQGTTLLGVLNVRYLGLGGGPKAEIRFQNGAGGGNAGTGITANDLVYFGFGDAALRNKKGQADGGPDVNALADAYISPEPVSLALLGLGALIMRRRR